MKQQGFITPLVLGIAVLIMLSIFTLSIMQHNQSKIKKQNTFKHELTLLANVQAIELMSSGKLKVDETTMSNISLHGVNYALSVTPVEIFSLNKTSMFTLITKGLMLKEIVPSIEESALIVYMKNKNTNEEIKYIKNNYEIPFEEIEVIYEMESSNYLEIDSFDEVKDNHLYLLITSTGDKYFYCKETELPKEILLTEYDITLIPIDDSFKDFPLISALSDDWLGDKFKLSLNENYQHIDTEVVWSRTDNKEQKVTVEFDLTPINYNQLTKITRNYNNISHETIPIIDNKYVKDTLTVFTTNPKVNLNKFDLREDDKTESKNEIIYKVANGNITQMRFNFKENKQVFKLVVYDEQGVEILSTDLEQ